MEAVVSVSGKATPHYQAVLKHSANLVKQIEFVLPVIANELYAKQLIGPYQQGKAMASGVIAYDRASELKTYVLTKIDENVRWYFVLMECLEECSLTEFAKAIEATRQKFFTWASPGIQVGGVLSSCSMDSSSRQMPPDKEQTLFKPNENEDSAFQDEMVSFSEQNTPNQATRHAISDSSELGDKGASHFSTENVLLPHEATNSEISGRLAVGRRQFVDITHLDCKKEVAMVKRKKERVEADLKCLTTIREEEKKLVTSQRMELLQFREELNKQTNIVENLTIAQEKKNEEITKLRSQREELEIKIRELSKLCKSEQAKNTQQQKEIEALQENRKEEEERTDMQLASLCKELEEIKLREIDACNEVKELQSQLALHQVEKDSEEKRSEEMQQKLEANFNFSLTTDRLVATMKAQLMQQHAQEREDILKKELEQEREARMQQKIELENKIASLKAEVAKKDEQLEHYQLALKEN